MLEAVELTKHFKKNKVVDGLNLFIEKGETVGLLGPNGAGKSTTISMISTLISPTDGDVRLKNESVLRDPQPLREVLGVVPQEIALYTDLTAKENLEFFGRINHLKGGLLKERVTQVLDQIGLTERKNDIVKTFSGGMKRRLNIGVALLHEPEILIMDEPTVGIDPQSRSYILEQVKRLNQEKGMTIIYTSHYMEEVEFLCDRIYIMDKGHIIASGTKEEIKSILSSESTIVIKLEKMVPTFTEGLSAIPSVMNVTSSEKEIVMVIPKEQNLFNQVFQLAEDTGAVILSIDRKTPTLEDVFLHLTGRALRD
ncbi:antibiotic ABC transporter ATP-binding protein [Rossellomorea marisflavi]|uniref:Antibiotic ABC transporter ATP-binding protein n=1 Tax=Rossellomorea marisflavi TaxID=189381 RepID=A0A0M0GMG5_9BACI|nr:ABC transporter ATP-binding protein [Rossellomorea marisflavi]KON90621.1 antibiotic ABC transporter ATP-binding protein [Rossellomorea marisflavi]UTE72713.1 ABC transporter ATP-binding protein [Rossellomorea marisflavi]GLI84746.1 ABC transporter ATP-binding protein [Rossellomorea marisflavi]